MIRTVDGDGNALVKSIAVSANECWDFAKLVDLQVLIGDTLRCVGLDDLELDVVGLGHSANSGGAGVALMKTLASRRSSFGKQSCLAPEG